MNMPLTNTSFITEMSNHVRLTEDNADNADIDMFFPHFLYVVRDFTLKLERDGQEISEDEYLESSLALNVNTFISLLIDRNLLILL